MNRHPISDRDEPTRSMVLIISKWSGSVSADDMTPARTMMGETSDVDFVVVDVVVVQ